MTLSRIGKITWFWSTMNKLIYDDFNKMQNIEKFFIKLEDINQNFNFYTKLSEKFNFENRMNKNQFYNVLNKTPNNDTSIDYSYKDWNELEKKNSKISLMKYFLIMMQLKQAYNLFEI